MKKIIFALFLLSFPINAIAYPNFSGEPDDLHIYLLNATNISIADSLKNFALLVHNKEYDKAFFPIQKCYNRYFEDGNQFTPGFAECLGVDYSITRSVNEANQQAEKNDRPKPYNIPFFEWSAFEKRILKVGISKKYIVFNAKDATIRKANDFSKTKIAITRYSEYDLYIWLNYCPEKFNEMVAKIFAIP